MAYILLGVGISLVVYAIFSLRREKSAFPDDDAKISSRSNGFSNLLSEDIIIKRLDELDTKLDKISSTIENRSIEKDEEDIKIAQKPVSEEKSDDLSINNRITAMHQDGMEIDEIASKLGIMKGEVLLRLGMKK